MMLASLPLLPRAVRRAVSLELRLAGSAEVMDTGSPVALDSPWWRNTAS